MPEPTTDSDPYLHRLLSGADRRPSATALRLALSAAEPFYSTALRTRNLLYDAALLPARKLPRPTVSIGNITTGGTGKTPVTRYLAEQLLARNLHPAILLRGYKSTTATGSDEAAMLASQLPTVPVAADPDRATAAWSVLKKTPIDLFLLDDAFQHRKVQRDFDLVLINAPAPFGHDHVLPRGLLREPLTGLARAHAFVLTRSDQTDPAHLRETGRTLNRHNPAAPVYHASHTLTALLDQHGQSHPLGLLTQQKFFAFAGIGNPQSLHRQLSAFAPTYAGQRWLPDHAPYTPQTLADLTLLAQATGATCLVTTEKDYTKLQHLPPPQKPLPLYRLDLRITFRGDEGAQLLTQLLSTLNLRPPV